MLGPRIADTTATERKKLVHFKPHNPFLMCLGTVLIWFGWFAFNGEQTPLRNSTRKFLTACVSCRCKYGQPKSSIHICRRQYESSCMWRRNLLGFDRIHLQPKVQSSRLLFWHYIWLGRHHPCSRIWYESICSLTSHSSSNFENSSCLCGCPSWLFDIYRLFLHKQ